MLSKNRDPTHLQNACSGVETISEGKVHCLLVPQVVCRIENLVSESMFVNIDHGILQTGLKSHRKSKKGKRTKICSANALTNGSV